MSYGIDTAFTTARAPWDGIGTKLEGAATAEEAIIAAGLDWRVVKKNLYFKNGGYTPVKGRQALVRVDTGEALGVFSPKYSALQNIDAFKAESTVMQDHGAVFHSAGSLNGGRRIWVYAELPESLIVAGNELARGILLTNSHDGSAAVSMQLMAVNRVCFNTMVRNFKSGGFRVVHTGDLDRRLSEARSVLGIQNQYFEDMAEGVESMAEQSMVESERFLQTLFGVKLDAEDVGTRVKNQMDVVQDLFYHGIGNKGLTKWDMYNAVTEYVDHHRGPSSGDQLVRSDRRLNSAWFGSGAVMKEKAWEMLTTISI